MTRSGVGRLRRTASRSAYAFALPSTQTVVGHTTGRAAVRLGLRTLAVAGFAGAAWLLSANAAQAAEDPATDLPSAASAQLATSMADALAAAYQPALRTPSAVTTGAVAPAGGATSVVLPAATATRAIPIPAAVPSLGAGRGADVADTAAATVTNTLAGAVPAATGLVRAADPLSRVLPPVTTTLRSAAAPVTATLDTVTRPAMGIVAPANEPRDPALGGGHARVTPMVPAGGRVATTATTAAVTGPGQSVTGARSSTATRTPKGARLRPAGEPAGRGGGGSNRPLPVPLRASGLGSGTSATWPGSPSEGGAVAAVSASVAGGTVEFHRPRVPADVVVARQDAESPTVSPD